MNNQTDIWGVEKKSIIDYFNDASMMLCWSAVSVYCQKNIQLALGLSPFLHYVVYATIAH